MRPVTALLAAAASALVAVGLVAPATGAQAAASPSPSSSASASPTPSPTAGGARSSADEARLEIAPADAGTLVPGSDLTVALRVTNGTDEDLRAGTIRVYLDRPAFDGAAGVSSWLDPDDPGGSDYLGSLVASVQVPEVGAGESLELDPVTVPESRLGLAGQAWGARALGARWLVSGDEAAQVRSSVTWFPSQDFVATRLAVAAPLTTPETSTGVLDEAALAAYTSPSGTLTKQLDALLTTDAAIGVDPMVLASIRLLGDDAPASATSWLAELEAAPNEVFPLTYADSDISGLRQAGAASVLSPTSFDDVLDASRFDASATASPSPPAAEREPATEETPAATDTTSGGSDASDDTAQGGSVPDGDGQDGTGDGRDDVQTPAPSTPTTDGDAPPTPTLESLLSVPTTLPALAWPARGTTVAADLPVFAASGFASTILDGTGATDDDDTTDDAHATVEGSDALVSDADVTRLLEEAAGARDDLAWQSAVARLSATVASVAHERPSEARTLLATLDRGWSTSSGRLGQTLTTLEQQPWATGARLADALAVAPSTATITDRPETDDRVAALATLVDGDRRVTDFATVLEDPDVVTGTTRLRTLALASTAWATNEDGLADELAAYTADVDATVASVAVVEGSDVAILGDRSSLPVYVQNATDSAATVYLTVEPSNSFLSVEDSSIPVTVQAQSQGRVMVPVTSIANGPVVVTMTLASQTGVPVGTPASVSITVQAGWETAITGTLGALVVLLFGGGILRSVLKRRRARAAGGDGAPADDADDHEAGDHEADGGEADGPGDDGGPEAVAGREPRA